jgi:Protein of unknown function (DUF3311)
MSDDRGSRAKADVSEPAGETGGSKPGVRASSGRRQWYWLLLLPYVGLLWMPFYAKAEPQLGGIPFFYWYQFLWVFITMVLIELVYRSTR